MADPWATATDVRRAWLLDDGDLPEDEQIDTWIAKAERHIRNRDKTIVARMTADPDLAASALDVVVEMVIRVLLNPERARAVADGTGPFTGSTTFAGDDPGGLYLTEENRIDLGMREPRRRRTGKAFTIDTTPTTARHRRAR